MMKQINVVFFALALTTLAIIGTSNAAPTSTEDMDVAEHPDNVLAMLEHELSSEIKREADVNHDGLMSLQECADFCTLALRQPFTAEDLVHCDLDRDGFISERELDMARAFAD